MELKDFFDLHEKLETRINAYWTYWSVAVFAIGGWLFAGRQGLSPSQAVAVALGVSVFFFCNLGVLWQATKLVTGIRDEIRHRSEDESFLSSRLRSELTNKDLKFRLQITIVLHLAIDAVVIWALLNVGVN